VGGGVINNIVYSLTVLGSNLYLGGTFSLPSFGIAIWNGTSFSGISGDIFNGAIRTIYVQNASSVFIGGDFTLMNGVTTMRHISRWNGSAWIEPNNGLNDDVFSIIAGSSAGTLYIGGKFNTTGNASKTLNRICYYDGTAFQSVGSATDANAGVSSDVNTLVLSGSTLYLGGKFQTNNLGTPTTLNRWATQNTASLTNPISRIGSGYAGAPSVGMNGDVNKIVVNSGIVYAVGSFTTVAGLDQEYFVAYNASASDGANRYSSTAQYLNGSIQSMLLSGSTLYIGGNFTSLIDNTSTVDISNLGGLAQIPLTFNSTTYATTGQPSITTPPIFNFNTYFTS
jgi:hypothetical protein